MTTRTANDPLRQLEKLRSRIIACSGQGPMLVWLDNNDTPHACVENGPRHQLLKMRPGFDERVAGVYDMRCTLSQLGADIRAVRG